MLLLVASAVALAVAPAPAQAHDPGQGRPIAPVTLTGTSDGRGTIIIAAESDNDCAALPPRRVVARRAGRIVTSELTATGRCRYAGQAHVPATGRWLLHVELRPPGFEVEAWLPVDAISPNRLVQHRQLYLPAGGHKVLDRPAARSLLGSGCTPWRVAAGADRPPRSRPRSHAVVAVTGARVARSTCLPDHLVRLGKVPRDGAATYV